jgi:arsenite methyltransferase
MRPAEWTKPDFGVDAPAVLRNLLVIGAGLVVAGFFLPHWVRIGSVYFGARSTFFGTGAVLLAQGLLMLYYVKAGKFRHRDSVLGMYAWRGDEAVLDVGCGRGLLLVGAAKRLTRGGRATGIDLWSNVDMGGNSEVATQRNLELEGVADRCELVSGAAQERTFADASFDVVVSNLCLHNIYDKAPRMEAVAQIVRVLKPGGVALISDYKLTGEYAAAMAAAGLTVEKRWGSFVSTFPPMRVVVARKQ